MSVVIQSYFEHITPTCQVKGADSGYHLIFKVNHANKPVIDLPKYPDSASIFLQPISLRIVEDSPRNSYSVYTKLTD